MSPIARAASSSASSSGKSKQMYVCRECGETTLQWAGKCAACQGWGTLEKVALQSADNGGGGGGARAAARFSASKAASEAGLDSFMTTSSRRSRWIGGAEDSPLRLTDISSKSRKQWRMQLPGPAGRELSRVLGGGLVPGSLVLVGGEPGVGKSTLLLQMANLLTNSAGSDGDEQQPVLYVSGEESTEQIGERAIRMGMGANDMIFLHSATRLDSILDCIATLQPRAVIVDSIQTMYLDELPSSAGSIVQVRECAAALLQVAKRERVPILLVGHVTKSGDIAGPRVLEHIVDVVVYMEGGRQQPVRMVRTVKNRYGATDEVGIFSMEETGMVPVPDPSKLFLSGRDAAPGGVGSAVTVVMEGSRPMLMEIQALCSPIAPGAMTPPTRSPTGLKKERLWLLLAVLGKHTPLRPHSVDVHLNVTGGLTLTEPAADVAVSLAIASSYCEKPIPKDVAAVGEIGLGGELRQVAHAGKRVAEAAKMGFTRIIVPARGGIKLPSGLDAELIEVRNISEAITAILGPEALETRKGRGRRQVPRFAQEGEFYDG